MNRGPGRPPHPDVLTPAEWRVLEQLRAGKPNAEIAVRLGISVNTVKYHVANILAKLELPDREAAAVWDGEPRRVRMLAPVLWLVARLGSVGSGAVGVAAASAVVVAMAVIGGGSGGDSAAPLPEATVVVTPEPEVTPTAIVAATDVAPASTATPVAAGLPFEQHAEYRGYGAEELAAAGFVDTGAFLRVPGRPYPVAESSYRAGFTGVRVADAGMVTVDVGGIWSFGLIQGAAQSTQTGIKLVGDVGSERVQLTLSGELGTLQLMAVAQAVPVPTRIMRVGTDGAAFYLDGGGPDDRRPQLILHVGDGEGRSYPAVIDTWGRLWVRSAPVVDGPVVPATGEALGITEGTLIAWEIAPTQQGHRSWCPPEGGCYTIIESALGLRAPADGRLSCVAGSSGDLAFLVEAGGYRIEYAPLAPLSAEVPVSCEGAMPRAITEREALSEHFRWMVTATDTNGDVAHVVAGGEFGFEYWVGVDAPTITTCPPCIGPASGP